MVSYREVILREGVNYLVISSSSCFHIANKTVSLSSLTISDLPFCLPPDQNTLLVALDSGLGWTTPPVGVSNWLSIHPFPPPFTCPVIQTCTKLPQVSLRMQFSINVFTICMNLYMSWKKCRTNYQSRTASSHWSPRASPCLLWIAHWQGCHGSWVK